MGRAGDRSPVTANAARVEPVRRHGRAGEGGLTAEALTRIHHWVKAIEPWGILLAVLALWLSVISFWLDYTDRVEDRTVRAWSS